MHEPTSIPDDALREVIAGIEVFFFGREAGAAAPLVFVTHGRGGKVADIFPFCRDLAREGLVAAAVEQRNHGRRLVGPLPSGNWGPTFAADIYSIIVGTALDISLLIDMIPARVGISTATVGMTGISLGGHATFMAMCLDQRIAVGAPLIGSGHYRRLMELRAEVNGTPPERFADYYPAALDRAVQRYDPINHPERFAERPLLMLNGGADALVQPKCNREFEQVVRPHYSDQERLKLSIYPGVGHDVPPAMWQEAAEWLSRWLHGIDG